MNNIIISNNKSVYEKHPENTIYIKGSYMKVLELTRDKIHLGHKLLTHPLSGSIKPNETPYKTIMISKEKTNLCEKSLNVIEESIKTVRKFQDNRPTPKWKEEVLKDFRLVDLSLIENALK